MHRVQFTGARLGVAAHSRQYSRTRGIPRVGLRSRDATRSTEYLRAKEAAIRRIREANTKQEQREALAAGLAAAGHQPERFARWLEPIDLPLDLAAAVQTLSVGGPSSGAESDIER